MEKISQDSGTMVKYRREEAPRGVAMRSTFLLTLLLAAPAASATWYAYGSYEPNTEYDGSAYMWQEPPGLATQRVYFNGVTMQAPGMNPNVGALATRFETAGLEFHAVLMGRWIDCNGDGYIGLAETAALEYRSEILLGDEAPCPRSMNGPWSGQSNHDGWVSEFIPISRTAGRDERVFPDPMAMVWADYGAPGAPPLGRPGCLAASLPDQGARSVGAFLDHVDCLMDASTGGASQEAQDFVGDLVPSSIREPVDDAQDELYGASVGDAGTPIYGLVEGDSYDASASPRRSSDLLFTFHDQPRGTGLGSPLSTPPGPADLGITALAPICAVSDCLPSGWYAEPRARSAATTVTTRLSLGDPGADFADARLTTYYGRVGGTTFSGRGLALPSSWLTNGRPYGAEACGDGATDIRHGWDCDATRWYPHLAIDDPSRHYLPSPNMWYEYGSRFHLRDVDCADGGIEATGIGIGISSYGPSPCPNAPVILQEAP